LKTKTLNLEQMKIEEQNSNKPLNPQLNIGADSGSFNVGDEVELEVYSEICCELCNDIINNHIDCPVCKSDYAKTDQCFDLDDEKEVTCEDCGTTFAKTSDSWYYDCKAKIVSLSKNCH
jgi:hypothetical protein